jgi:Flp pilus assembly protein TadG
MGRCTAKALAQLVRRFGRKQDGAVAIEFAIVALPFIWLLLIVFEAAAMLFTDIAIQNGLTDTARLIRTGQAQTQSMNATKFKQIMCANIASYIDCSKIRVDISKSATLPITGVNMMTVNDTTPQSYQVGGPSEWVMVQARYDWKLFIPGISQLSNYSNASGVKMRRLTAGALFRNEPYGG